MDTSFDLRASRSWRERSKRYKCLFVMMSITLVAIVFNNYYPAWFGDKGLFFECVNVTLGNCHPTDTRGAGVQVTQMVNSASMGMIFFGYVAELVLLCMSNSARFARFASIPNQMIVVGGILAIVSFIISIWTLRTTAELTTVVIGWSGGLTLWSCIFISAISSRVLYEEDSALTSCNFAIRYTVLALYFLGQTPIAMIMWIVDIFRRLCGCPQQARFNLNEGIAGVVSSQSRLQSFSHLIEGSTSASQLEGEELPMQEITSPLLTPIEEECEFATTEFGADSAQSETADSEQVDSDQEAAQPVDVGCSEDSTEDIERQVKPDSPSRKHQDEHEKASSDRE